MNGYKTIVFNAVMLLVFILNTFKPELGVTTDDASVAVEGINQLIIIVGGVGNLILRHFSNSPIAYKK